MEKPIEQTLFFAGIDPGIHNLSVIIVNETGKIVYASHMDLIPERNANRTKVDIILNELSHQMKHGDIAKKLSACKEIGIEAQMRRKLAMIAAAIHAIFHPRCKFISKKRYFPEACTGNYTKNKRNAVKLAGPVIRNFFRECGEINLDIQIHDFCEAYRLADFLRREYLNRKKTKKRPGKGPKTSHKV